MFNDFVSIFLGCLYNFLPEHYHNNNWFTAIIITGISFIVVVMVFLFIIITMHDIIKYIIGGRKN